MKLFAIALLVPLLAACGNESQATPQVRVASFADVQAALPSADGAQAKKPTLVNTWALW